MKGKIKILIVVGARPNFIKIAPIFSKLKKYKNIKSLLVHTGQHYDFEMSSIFFKELNIPEPDYNLEVGSGSHAWQTAKTMERLEPLLFHEKPYLLIVVGDVNSTLAGALTAAKSHIPVAHIEAGLRGFNKQMPEEINRVLTDHISDFLFCPTKTAVLNLKKEGIVKGVFNTGDIMYDVFLKMIKIATKKSEILRKMNLEPKKYYLATLHRAENTEDREVFKNIINVFSEIKNLIFPCHPRTEKLLKKYNLLGKLKKKIRIIKPVGYIDMLWLEKNAQKILTDSGGMQKEAYFLGVPCITLRDETEWVETVRDKWNILVGHNKRKIIEAVKFFNPSEPRFKHYGDGKAADNIIKIIINN